MSKKAPVSYNTTTVVADENEYRLVRDLLRSYDKRIRPSKNYTESLNVTFGLALSQIIDVMWIDFGLRWDPAKYGGIKVIRLPHDSIWRPDILLYNNADVSSYFSSISSNVIVTADGNVTWLSMVIFKSSCSINVRYFPFDEQNCSMQFASWTYDSYQINLVLTTNDGDTSNYIPNSEWDMKKLYVERTVKIYSCCAEPYPVINFYVFISRRPLFYIFNMVMPCIMITLVALLGFYIPSESGEKVTMGITTLLSMTVFMMLVAENMPPTSNVLPLVGIYYGITIGIVSTATGMTVLTLNIHHKGNKGRQIPHLVRTIFFGIFAKIFCVKLDTDACRSTKVEYISPDDHHFERENITINGSIPSVFSINSQNRQQPNSSESFEQQFSKVLVKVYQTIERNEKRLADQEERDVIRTEWQQVALIVDRLLLSGFVVLTLVMTLAIMLQAPQANL
ncbi:hypothetical protein KUTeg_008776 [Tegillarca granosa]|uniref:Uncharacterized protein n=1 Tax=Tegillarca granosa TaxID=220873 RepID=A0ABQ9FD52_TEGGR|nr:hypothetical protein KUTeg_008776 [Tegillarca granosa]